jgi:hypothetical protein
MHMEHEMQSLRHIDSDAAPVCKPRTIEATFRAGALGWACVGMKRNCWSQAFMMKRTLLGKDLGQLRG